MKTLLLPLVLFVILSSCEENEKTENKNPSPEKPVEADIRMKQRSAATLDSIIPGLQISIDDITGGAVLTTVNELNKTVMTGYFSAQTSANTAFKNKKLTVTCVKLENNLIGEDYATFHISWGEHFKKGADMESQEQIAFLLDHIRQSGLKFIRNGETYPSPDAAEFLEKKWNVTGKQIPTKEAFIREIATKSSTTGQYYMVVLENGEQIRLANWLRNIRVPVSAPTY
jgi:hypothetical protein